MDTNNNDKMMRMKQLIEELNNASVAYYQNDNPIYTDKEYDDKCDELEQLETETGIVLSNSPIHKVQGFLLKGLEKKKHSKPMLSANKTKDTNEIKKFIGNRTVMCSYKYDGLTLVVKYSDGHFVEALTRGSGEFGEVVTEQAKMIKNLPMQIPFKGELELRGECVISWDNFNKINEGLSVPYSHPRNLAAGNIRTLDTNITRERNLEYVVFELVSYNDDNTYKEIKYRSQSLNWLDKQGFTTACRVSIPSKNNSYDIEFLNNSDFCENVDEVLDGMTAEQCKYPVDGLIFNYEDLSYSMSLGSTIRYPLDMMALKWENETYETELIDVEWATSRTGRINPRAHFKTVTIEGSAIEYATVHNVSIVEELQLGKGDMITVYKANQIIPAIDENLTMSGTCTPPKKCPCCGSDTIVKMENKSKTLWCTNEKCPAKLSGKLEVFVSKEAMNVDGLSKAQLSVFIRKGWLNNLSEVYSLPEHAADIQKLDGFGKRSVEKLMNSIEKSKDVDLAHFLNGLCIDGIGKSSSKDIAKFCNHDINVFREILSSRKDLSKEIQGFGEKMNKSLHEWFTDEDNLNVFTKLLKEVRFENVEENSSEASSGSSNILSEQTFVVTGKVVHFKNRNALTDKIVALGGHVASSVTAKVNYLIIDDLNSTSSKAKKARELGTKMINEEQFIDMIGGK